jgi:uncharacterized protein (TIGR02246 family)
MVDDELAMRILIDTWCRAMEAGNREAILPLMADDMVFVFLPPGQAPFGKREFAGGFRQSAGKEQIKVQAEVQEIRVTGDWAHW